MIAIAGPSSNGQYTVFDYESCPYRLYGTYSRQVDADTIRARVPLVRGSGTYSWSADGMREVYERAGWSVD